MITDESYDKRGRRMSTKFNKNPHWTCKKCGVHNQEMRVKCLGCNEDSDYH